MNRSTRAYAIALVLIFGGHDSLAINWGRWKTWFGKNTATESCQEILAPATVPMVPTQVRRETMRPLEALQAIESEMPALLRGRDPNIRPSWLDIIHEYLIPYLQTSSSHLVIEIVGPSNGGKSTIFNEIPKIFDHLHGQHEPRSPNPTVSETSLTAGNTVRPVLLVNSDFYSDRTMLKGRFGGVEDWKNLSSATQPGLPVVFAREHFFRNLIFVDTPSSDVDARNMHLEPWVHWADVFFYVFSGDNYANDFNLEVMRNFLTAAAGRNVVLIYRASPGISNQVIDEHFAHVAHAILPGAENDANTGLPRRILGTYVLNFHDDSGERVIAHGKSFPFSDFLQDMERNHSELREASLKNGLRHALNGVAGEMNRLQIITETSEMSDLAFQLLIEDSVQSMVEKIPRERLGAELENIWWARAQGMRNVSRWLAYPLRMFYGRQTEINSTGPGLSEVYRYMDTLIDQVIMRFRLVSLTGMMKVSSSLKDIDTFRQRFEDFRTAHAGLVDMTMRTVGDKVEIYLSMSPETRAQMQEYLARDWQEISDEIKLEARENLASLTLRIQAEFSQVLKQSGLAKRMTSGAYTVMAIAPALVAVYYMVWGDVNIMDPRGFLSMFGAHLCARFFVYLDERGVDVEWQRIVSEWYRKEEEPRLLSIFRNHLQLQTPAQSKQARRDLEHIQMALESF